MTENEVTIDGVRYVARNSPLGACDGCIADQGGEFCCKLPECSAYKRSDEQDVVWQQEDSEITSLRDLNRELVEAGKLCVSAWNSVCDAHGWDRNHLAQFPTLSALIAKARGEK